MSWTWTVHSASSRNPWTRCPELMETSRSWLRPPQITRRDLSARLVALLAREMTSSMVNGVASWVERCEVRLALLVTSPAPVAAVVSGPASVVAGALAAVLALPVAGVLPPVCCRGVLLCLAAMIQPLSLPLSGSNSRTVASSFSMTVDSLRIPSRIRSGVG